MIHFQMTGQDLNPIKINDLRGLKNKKEARVKVGKSIFNVAAVSGLAAAQHLLNEMDAGRASYQIVEVMACPYGCVNGGGQPFGNDERSLKSKMKALYDVDEEEMIRTPYKNPIIADLYEKFMATPGHERNREFLYVRHGNAPIV
jgi:iron only hydrogenase large subunit-like protein